MIWLSFGTLILTLENLEGRNEFINLKKKILPKLMKFCILLGYKFRIKKLKFWGQSVHFWSRENRIIHRWQHASNLSFDTMTFDLG